MRIAYLVHQYPPDHVGGTEVYTHGLASRAQASGHEVLVLTYRESTANRLSDFEPIARPTRASYEHDNPFVGARVPRLLAEWRPDIAHVTHGMKLTVAAMDACRALGIPAVVSLTDYWFLCPRHTLLTWDGRLCDGPSEWRECFRCLQDLHGVATRRRERRAVQGRPDRTRMAVESAARVFALSSFLKRMYVANGYDPERIEVLPHGIETEGLHPAGPRRPGPTRFLFVGSLQPFKGAHVPVEALAADPGLDVELVLHGAGGPAEYAERLARSAGGDARIVLAGRFEPGDLPRILGGTDYVLIPALWYENEPIIVKAANHIGIPVLASRIGSLVEMIEEGLDGWTVPPGDVAAWLEAMRRAVLERDRWQRVPRPQPSMDDQFAYLDGVYAELAAARSAVRT